jgi:hypothetical protein
MHAATHCVPGTPDNPRKKIGYQEEPSIYRKSDVMRGGGVYIADDPAHPTTSAGRETIA